MKETLQKFFNNLINGEKSIQSTKSYMPEDDEKVIKDIFKSLDIQKKGFLAIDDLLIFLNKLNIET